MIYLVPPTKYRGNTIDPGFFSGQLLIPGGFLFPDKVTTVFLVVSIYRFSKVGQAFLDTGCSGKLVVCKTY